MKSYPNIFYAFIGIFWTVYLDGCHFWIDMDPTSDIELYESFAIGVKNVKLFWKLDK